MKSSAGRRLTLMLVCLASWLAVVVAINWIVNPYGVWRTAVVDRAYRVTDAGADEIGERLSTRPGDAGDPLDTNARPDATSAPCLLTDC